MTNTFYVELGAGLVVAVLGWLAGRSSRLLYLVFDGLFTRDLPKISGRFTTTYDEPDLNPPDQSGQRATITTHETIKAKRIGRYVFGTIVSSRHNTEYVFQARINRDVITGQFRPKIRRPSAAGIGAFQLRSADGGDKSFVGHQLWVDYDTQKVENSVYTWQRIAD
ncbi:MAG: hypothetical protein WAU68_05785 [Vitreimonas sp.]